MRLVIDLIRGKGAAEAIGILRFSKQHASVDAEKALRSAVANLLNVDEEIDPDTIFVKEVFVDQGPSMKRTLPAPQGRAYRIRKRWNHLTVIVAGKRG